MASQLFGPEMWDILRANPSTAALLSDSDFKAVLEEIKSDPSSLSKHTSDPRVMQVFGTLAAASSAKMPGAKPQSSSSSSSSQAPGSTSRTPKEPVIEEENLDDLPEEKRNEKLSFREKEKGNAAYKSRDFDAAIACYTKAFELHPKNVALLTNRAAAKFEAGDYDGAIKDCQDAIKRNQEYSLRTDFKVIARAWSRIGNAFMKLDKLEEAVESYAKSLTEFHDDKVYKLHKETMKLKEKRDTEKYIDPEISNKERAEGNELFKKADFPGSIKKYTEAIKRNPSDPAPYSNRAASYMKLGEFPMALKDCDRCLDLDPTFMKAYARKGNIHFFMKEYHKCLEVYEKGLEIDPNSAEMRQGLVKTQMKIREQQSSQDVDEEQVKHAMADPEIQKILSDGEVQTMLKQMEQDPSAAAKILRSDPKFAAKVEKLIAAGVLRVG